MMTIGEFFEKRLGPTLDNLSGRWQDEQEYEDWKDYVAVVRKMFDQHPQFFFQSMTKRPFAVTFTGDGKKWIAKCSSRQIQLLEVHQ